MVLDFGIGMLFSTDQGSTHKLSEEQKEQLKYMVEDVVLYKVLIDRELLSDEDLKHLESILSANGGILFPSIPEFEFPTYSYRDILNFQ